jgi:hypothetical protein
VLTSGEIDSAPIMAAARAFGWNTLTLKTLASVEKLPLDTVAAILFDRAAAGGSWPEAASRLRRIAPGIPLIACHHITEKLDWPAVSDAGAFHGVRVPLNEDELRQSFGYVWAAMQRDAAPVPARPNAAVQIRRSAA